MNNWRKVSEELPPVGVDALTWGHVSGFMVAEYTSCGYWMPSGNVNAYDLDMFGPDYWTELPPEPK